MTACQFMRLLTLSQWLDFISGHHFLHPKYMISQVLNRPIYLFLFPVYRVKNIIRIHRIGVNLPSKRVGLNWPGNFMQIFRQEPECMQRGQFLLVLPVNIAANTGSGAFESEVQKCQHCWQDYVQSWTLSSRRMQTFICTTIVEWQKHHTSVFRRLCWQVIRVKTAALHTSGSAWISAWNCPVNLSQRVLRVNLPLFGGYV